MKRLIAVLLVSALLLSCAPMAFAEKAEIAPEPVGAIVKSPANL